MYVCSLVPRPRPRGGKGLVTIERFLGCAESALRHLSCDFGPERADSGHGGSYSRRSTIQLKLICSYGSYVLRKKLI